MPIPTEALRGTDGDSGPEDLVYTIEQPSNGRVVLQATPGSEVRRFTQAQLDGRHVLFSHRGGCQEIGFLVLQPPEFPEDGEPLWTSRTQIHPCPQVPWTEASTLTSLMASTLLPDTSSK